MGAAWGRHARFLRTRLLGQLRLRRQKKRATAATRAPAKPIVAAKPRWCSGSVAVPEPSSAAGSALAPEASPAAFTRVLSAPASRAVAASPEGEPVGALSAGAAACSPEPGARPCAAVFLKVPVPPAAALFAASSATCFFVCWTRKAAMGARLSLGLARPQSSKTLMASSNRFSWMRAVPYFQQSSLEPALQSFSNLEAGSLRTKLWVVVSPGAMRMVFSPEGALESS